MKWIGKRSYWVAWIVWLVAFILCIVLINSCLDQPPIATTSYPTETSIWIAYFISKVFLWGVFCGLAGWIGYLLYRQGVLESKHQHTLDYEVLKLCLFLEKKDLNAQTKPFDGIKDRADTLAELLKKLYQLKESDQLRNKQHEALSTLVEERLKSELEKLNT